jgi:predicted ArsR family transcriptional regulator
MSEWDVLGVLAEPHRRSVYEWVCSATGAVTREEVADGVGISRSLAAFHLDRLVDVNLLDTNVPETASEADVPRRAGRPAKRYRRSTHDVQLSWPPRHYELVARVLAEAVATAKDGADARKRARRVSRREGERVSPEHVARPCIGVLADLGYAPAQAGSRIELRNCPFDGVVDVSPELVCGMNLAYLEGVLSGREDGALAKLEPGADRCCVVIEQRPITQR